MKNFMDVFIDGVRCDDEKLVADSLPQCFTIANKSVLQYTKVVSVERLCSYKKTTQNNWLRFEREFDFWKDYVQNTLSQNFSCPSYF